MRKLINYRKMNITVWHDEEKGITINFKDDELFPYTESSSTISGTRDNEPITLSYVWVKEDLLNVELGGKYYEVRRRDANNKVAEILFYELDNQAIAKSKKEGPEFTFTRKPG
jgi:hypothetical protein